MPKNNSNAILASHSECDLAIRNRYHDDRFELRRIILQVDRYSDRYQDGEPCCAIANC